MKDCLLNVTPLSVLEKIKVSQISKLAKIGLKTVQDLLLHIPLRYEDRTYINTIKNLLPGNYYTIEGKILNNSTNKNKKRTMTCQISDGSGILNLRFFNFNKTMENDLTVGQYVLVHGMVKISKYGNEMIHPEYYIHNGCDIPKLHKTLTPIYSTTKGIKQKTLRDLINKALNLMELCFVTELLPLELIKGIMSLPEALRTLHNPPSTINQVELKNKEHPAQRRLILEEMIAHNLCILKCRDNKKRLCAQPLPSYNKLKNKLLASLPFKLTNAQVRVIAEIEHDMSLDIPMMRLLQGDVGSGKTLVAALAALRVINYGKQVALMVPTELLAEQHFKSFCNWFTPLGIEVCWLTGKRKNKMYLIQQKNISNGKIKMVVGTHAIFQEQIKFNCLTLIIIDEQHRFGVHQRLALWEKGLNNSFYPHQLIMTATPIPRTLAMATCANLDISIIDELPPGRIPVTTLIISDQQRNNVINHVRNACINKLRQVYWVCTLIEKSDLQRVQAAKKIYEELKSALPELKIGLMHGRMKLIEKQEVIKSFKIGKLNLLVTTTIIETGIDISNVSLIIIENSERLGLTQLHQLRGRVGRSKIASYCVLLYKSPLSKNAKRRLQVLRNNNNGSVIAQKDLKIRGSGELFGIRQTGSIKFKIADIVRDHKLIPTVQRISYYMNKYYPEKSLALIERWISKDERYSNA